MPVAESRPSRSRATLNNAGNSPYCARGRGRPGDVRIRGGNGPAANLALHCFRKSGQWLLAGAPQSTLQAQGYCAERGQSRCAIAKRSTGQSRGAPSSRASASGRFPLPVVDPGFREGGHPPGRAARSTFDSASPNATLPDPRGSPQISTWGAKLRKAGVLTAAFSGRFPWQKPPGPTLEAGLNCSGSPRGARKTKPLPRPRPAAHDASAQVAWTSIT